LEKTTEIIKKLQKEVLYSKEKRAAKQIIKEDTIRLHKSCPSR
jgi:hypothetical protein